MTASPPPVVLLGPAASLLPIAISWASGGSEEIFAIIIFGLIMVGFTEWAVYRRTASQVRAMDLLLSEHRKFVNEQIGRASLAADSVTSLYQASKATTDRVEAVAASAKKQSEVNEDRIAIVERFIGLRAG